MAFKAKSLCMALATLLAFGAQGVNAAEKSDLQTIVDKGVVRLGAVNAPPYYDYDLATNKWSGLIPEITEAMFKTIGVKVEYVQTEWGTAVAGLQSGRFDIMGAYNATPVRALAIDFTKPVGYVPTALVTMKDDTAPYQSWEALNNPAIRIAAVDGAGTTRTAQKIAPKATWVLVPSNDAMLLEVESNRVDVALTSQPTVQDFIKARKKGTMVIPQPVIGNPANFGLPKNGSKELRDWMNIAIDAGKLDRSITDIWEKYLPSK